MSAPPSPHRLPPPLEAAIQRLKRTARAAAERSVESLGLAALSATHALQRDLLLEAQFELNRKQAAFALAFDEAFDERVLRESMPRAPGGLPSAWDTLSLLGDHELEQQVAAERFGLEVGHVCEWELRELATYIDALLPPGRAEPERHPLRPEIVGHAMLRGIDAVSERAEVRKLLAAEMTRSIGGAMRTTYADIVADLRAAGVQPRGLAVRTGDARAADAGRGRQGPETGRGPLAADTTRSGALGPESTRAAPPSRFGGPAPSAAGPGTPMGMVDPRLMSLLRQLAHFEPGFEGSGAGALGGAAAGGASAGAEPAPNLIRAHRDELRQASRGALDHMVIDVVGSLFDAILSDPKVPPQMARQIARLQLPVLRAALGDPSFFSSRRHPVRRFVNRIASLAAAYDDFADADAQRLLARVRDLVQDIVAGDFDQIEVYERQLAALEAFVAEQARREVEAQGDPASVLAAKEKEQQLHRVYARRLARQLQGLASPDFVREFLTEVWSRALLQAAAIDGPAGERVQRMRGTARELFMSVQPKSTPALRQAFIAALPKLMREIGEGLDLIGWPEAARKAFFGMLLPAHAESLKGQGLRTLEYNLLARQVEDAFAAPLPTPAELPAADPRQPPAADDAAEPPALSADEAARVGLVDEAAVNWDRPPDADPAAEPELRTEDLRIAGLPPPEPAEPAQGRALADQLQIGLAYRMHLEQGWRKVRLSHVSAGRSFYVFTHGERDRETISMTRRMLLKLCDSGRLRGFEGASLLERATARARRQLAAIAGAGAR